ncbi:MAG: dihydrofolate reductase family protein [Gemmatimonadales bacterium]|nr:dihydrofolate reductase family protein [Gemmatimonadales bacterium]
MTARPRVSVFIATSLDGFIARPDGALDWLPAPGGDGPADDHGYAAFMAGIDVVLMGRATFETVLGFGLPEWPYRVPVVVLATRPPAVPAALADRVRHDGGDPGAVLARLAERGLCHAYLDGGVTIQRFLAAGCVDTLILTRVPVLLGAGRPLFGPLPADVTLVHEGTTAFANGLVQSRYAVRHGAGHRATP